MTRRIRHEKWRKTILKTIAVLALLALPAWMTHNLAPVVRTICSSQAKILGTAAINKAVMAELERLNIDYGSLVRITTDNNGNVSVIETNAVEVNKLKSLLTDAVNDSLAAIPQQEVRVPLGTLTGIELLSGRGPRIRLRMQPASYVECTLSNRFDSAGINQTRHQIMVDFKVSMTAILAPYSTTVQVESNICIAETVIVGTVPEMFADIAQ
ncbi:MAG: sporulation protein YunB [Oscillospiraceae bacterium]|nr:sporulation protein YunB [Oscillospiraceae bacterium]